MRREKLRIIHTVSSLEGGGMEHFVLRLCEAQRARGHEASILAIKSGSLLPLAQSKGLPVTVLRGNRMQERIAHAVSCFLLGRPDIVHCHNPTALHYAALAKVMVVPRIVFTDHAQTKGIIRMPHPLEWRLTSAVVAVSGETAKRALVDTGYRGTPEVVHNGIDSRPALRTRDEVRAELGLGTEVVGINVASFFRVKAQDVLVQSLSVLKDRGVATTVLFVGEGEERPAVEKLAADLGVSSMVRFLGFRNDVPDLLGASDYFVLPSRGEGLPISVLEAMSHRLAVVATTVGGNPELVTDGEHGFLVPKEDSPALADAMARVALDPALRQRMGAAGEERVRHDFSFSAMTDRYEAIYRRVLERRLA